MKKQNYSSLSPLPDLLSVSTFNTEAHFPLAALYKRWVHPTTPASCLVISKHLVWSRTLRPSAGEKRVTAKSQGWLLPPAVSMGTDCYLHMPAIWGSWPLYSRDTLQSISVSALVMGANIIFILSCNFWFLHFCFFIDTCTLAWKILILFFSYVPSTEQAAESINCPHTKLRQPAGYCGIKPKLVDFNER